MEFIVKAAALAFSILASVFGGSDAPKAAPVQNPAVASRQASPPSTVRFSTAQGTPAPRIVRVMFIRPRSASTVLDPDAERFLALVRSRPTVKHAMTGLPWYAKFESSREDQVKAAVDVFRALVSDDQSDF